MVNHGFQPDTITTDQYTFGGGQVETKVLQKDGQWDTYLPENELQRKHGVETMSCVSFGTLNAIEMLLKRKYDR